MTWQFDVNTVYAPATPEDALGGMIYKLKALMSTHGSWAVRGSGDGLSAYEDIDDGTGGAGTGDGGAYDVITQESAFNNGAAGDMGNVNAWFRIRETGSTREWVFQRSATGTAGGADNLRLVFSRTGFLTAGNATTRPTAVDEVVLRNDVNVGSTFNNQTVNVHVGVENAAHNGVYAWYTICVDQNTSDVLCAMIYDGLEEELVGDPDPFAFIVGGALSSSMTVDHLNFSNTHRAGSALAYGADIPAGIPIQSDGNHRTFPIPVVYSAGDEWKGYLKNVRWKGGAQGYPDTRERTTVNAQLFAEDCLIPWEQNTVPLV